METSKKEFMRFSNALAAIAKRFTACDRQLTAEFTTRTSNDVAQVGAFVYSSVLWVFIRTDGGGTQKMLSYNVYSWATPKENAAQVAAATDKANELLKK